MCNPFVVIPDTTKPSVGISSPSSSIPFTISILRLTERDLQRNTAKKIQLDETTNFTFSESRVNSSMIWTYTSILSNGARLTIAVSFFFFFLSFS